MNNSDYQSYYNDLARRYLAVFYIWKYVPPVILCVGTVGNVLTVVVMCRRRMRRLNIAIPFICLAFSDICNLYSGLLRNWMYRILHIDLRTNYVSCKFIVWLSSTSSQYSSWIVVVITVDRFMSIYFPIDSRSRSRKYSAPLRMGGLLLFLMTLNSHYIYGYVLDGFNRNHNRTECSLRADKTYRTFAFLYWSWIDLSLLSFLPFTILTFCNTAIIFKLKRGMKTLTEGQNGTKNRKARKTVNVKMILLLSTVFLVCTLPINVYTLAYNYRGGSRSYLEFYNWLIVEAVTFSLDYTNYAANFFLYLVSGRLIRNEFLSIFCKTPKGKQGTSTSVTALSQ